jgi:hypothetical protein
MVKTAVSVAGVLGMGETAVTLSSSTPHPTSKQTQYNKNKCNRVITSSQNYDFAKQLYMQPSGTVWKTGHSGGFLNHCIPPN